MTSGNFNKLPANMVSAMKDSNYFERKGVEGVYEPRNTKAPIVTGSFKGDSKGFLDKFKEGALSNLEKSKEKSDTDKYLDFMRESRGMMRGNAQFGGFGGGMATEVAQGLNIYQPTSPNQQMFIPGQKGEEGLFSLGGAIKGGIGGFMKGGPAGAIGGAALGGFM
tara:strand:+ start:3784 stop:4278 length:495 start_codon:yes stop_codon:yes gene_type:complete